MKRIARMTRSGIATALAALALSLVPLGALAQGADDPVICPYCNLAGTDFSGQTLVDANFYRANLAGVSFRGAVLRGVSFAQADLGNADFSGALLDAGPMGQPTDLGGADLTGADFTGTVFADADMQFAEIGCASFRNADMSGVVAGPALSVDRAVCRPDFTGATLSCAMSIGGVHAPGCAPAAAVADVASAGWACPGLDLSTLASAIYVSTGGSDSDSCGADPSSACASVEKGVAQCSAAGCGVLIEAQQYSLGATLSLPAGTGLYGGCVAGSSVDPSYTSTLNGPSGGAPLVSVSGATGVILQSLRLYATDAAGTTGAPSVAVLLTDGADVAFNQMQVLAGRGGAGQAGSDGGPVDCTRAPGGAGGPAMTPHVNYVWYSGKFQSCEPASSNTANDGRTGGAAGSLLGGAGGKIGGGKCTTGCDGCTGANGPGGTAGTHGSCGVSGQPSNLTSGSFPGGVWTASLGQDGTPGAAGSGGGGGASGQGCARECELIQSDEDGGAGGAGGAGACGTTAGTGGQQGGASIGIQVVASSFSFDDLTITGAKGGAGGDGGDNSPAQAGAGGSSGQSGESLTRVASGGTGGAGGAGGWGGSSGAGAGGNGGPSIGIAFVNAAEVANVMEIYISEGAPGEVGLPGVVTPNVSNAPCTTDAAVKGHPGDVNKYQMFNE